MSAPLKTLLEVKRDHVLLALTHHRWNIYQTAKTLRIDRGTLHRLIKKFGLRPPSPERRVVPGSVWKFIEDKEDPIRIVTLVSQVLLITQRSSGSGGRDWGSRDDFFSRHTHVSDPPKDNY